MVVVVRTAELAAIRVREGLRLTILGVVARVAAAEAAGSGLLGRALASPVARQVAHVAGHVVRRGG